MSLEVNKAAEDDTHELHAIMEEGRLFKLSLGDTVWGKEPYTIEEVQARINQGNTFIGDDFRGQDIGEQLINWASEQTKAAGFTKLRLDCPAEDEKLCSYYESQGFSRVGTVKVYDNSSALFERTVN